MGIDLNQPLMPIGTHIHQGQLPASASAVKEVTPGNVILNCIKKAEDEDAVVFRLYETQGKSTTADVKLDSNLMGKVKEASEVDLLERSLRGSTAKCTPDGFRVMLPAYGITSVKLTFVTYGKSNTAK